MAKNMAAANGDFCKFSGTEQTAHQAADHDSFQPAGLGQYAQTPETVGKILERIQYKDGFKFVTLGDTPEDMQIKVQYQAPDVAQMDDHSLTWRTDTRPVRINRNYGPGQIFNSVVGALKAVEEHELRENFRFDARPFYYIPPSLLKPREQQESFSGWKVFNPHFETDPMREFLVERGRFPTLPELTFSSHEEVQTLMDACNIMGYRFKVERAEMVDYPNRKMLLVIQIVNNPTNPVPPNPISEGMEGKKITFVTTNTLTKILHNLIDNIIQEQMNELNWRLKLDQFALYSRDIPMFHTIDYILSRQNRR
ncbi:MAG TPA: hypothetical protein V6C52_10450 [Coleofasciculaceae cyanobacterium]